MTETQDQDKYVQKLADLQKHVPFLEKMIVHLKSTKDKSREAQLSKMESLLSMLTNKNKKWKFDFLLKCEEVIEKLQSRMKVNFTSDELDTKSSSAENTETKKVKNTQENASKRVKDEKLSVPKKEKSPKTGIKSVAEEKSDKRVKQDSSLLEDVEEDEDDDILESMDDYSFPSRRGTHKFYYNRKFRPFPKPSKQKEILPLVLEAMRGSSSKETPEFQSAISFPQQNFRRPDYDLQESKRSSNYYDDNSRVDGNPVWNNDLSNYHFFDNYDKVQKFGKDGELHQSHRLSPTASSYRKFDTYYDRTGRYNRYEPKFKKEPFRKFPSNRYDDNFIDTFQNRDIDHFEIDRVNTCESTNTTINSWECKRELPTEVTVNIDNRRKEFKLDESEIKPCVDRSDDLIGAKLISKKDPRLYKFSKVENGSVFNDAKSHKFFPKQERCNFKNIDEDRFVPLKCDDHEQNSVSWNLSGTNQAKSLKIIHQPECLVLDNSKKNASMCSAAKKSIPPKKVIVPIFKKDDNMNSVIPESSKERVEAHSSSKSNVPLINNAASKAIGKKDPPQKTEKVERANPKERLQPAAKSAKDNHIISTKTITYSKYDRMYSSLMNAKSFTSPLESLYAEGRGTKNFKIPKKPSTTVSKTTDIQEDINCKQNTYDKKETVSEEVTKETDISKIKTYSRKKAKSNIPDKANEKTDYKVREKHKRRKIINIIDSDEEENVESSVFTETVLNKFVTESKELISQSPKTSRPVREVQVDTIVAERSNIIISDEEDLKEVRIESKKSRSLNVVEPESAEEEIPVDVKIADIPEKPHIEQIEIERIKITNNESLDASKLAPEVPAELIDPLSGSKEDGKVEGTKKEEMTNEKISKPAIITEEIAPCSNEQENSSIDEKQQAKQAILDEVSKKNLHQSTSADVLEFILKNYKHIKKIFESDSSSSDESLDDKNKKRKKKKKRKKHSLSSASSSDRECEERNKKLKVDTVVEEEKKAEKNDIVNIQEQNSAEVITTDDKIDPKQDEKVHVEIAAQKTLPKKRLNAEQKPRKRELDMLHADIKEMWMCEGIITASSKRSCTFSKDYTNLPLVKPKTPNSNLTIQEFIARGARLRVMLKREDLHQLKERFEMNIKSSPPKKKRKIVAWKHTPNDETEVERDISPTRMSVSLTTVPSLESVLQKSSSLSTNLARVTKTTSPSAKELSKHHDRNYFIGGDKTPCRLCSFKGKFISSHYKTRHPDNEVLISRMDRHITERLIVESKQNCYDSIVLKSGPKEKYLYVCPFCQGNIIVDFTQHFYDHLTSHTGEYRYCCDECNYSWHSATCLHNHYTKHDKKVKLSPRPAPPNSNIILGYVCGECYYVQTLKENLQKHTELYHSNMADVFTINMNLMELCSDEAKQPLESELCDLSEGEENDSAINDFLEVKMEDDQIVSVDDLESNSSQDDAMIKVEDNKIQQEVKRGKQNNIENKSDKSNETNLTAFICESNIDDSKIEEKRLQKMNKILQNVNIPRMSIVDRLQNKLVSNDPDAAGTSHIGVNQQQKSIDTGKILKQKAKPSRTFIAETKQITQSAAVTTETISKEPEILNKTKPLNINSAMILTFGLDSEKTQSAVATAQVSREDGTKESGSQITPEIASKKSTPISSIINRLQDKLQNTGATENVEVNPQNVDQRISHDFVNKSSTVTTGDVGDISSSLYTNMVDHRIRHDILNMSKSNIGSSSLPALTHYRDLVGNKSATSQNIAPKPLPQVSTKTYKPSPKKLVAKLRRYAALSSGAIIAKPDNVNKVADDAPPPLYHYKNLTPNEKAELLLQAGPIKLLKQSGGIQYACFVKFCVFSTYQKHLFERHCRMTHAQVTLDSWHCNVCNTHFTKESAFNLHNVFIHVIDVHNDLCNDKVQSSVACDNVKCEDSVIGSSNVTSAMSSEDSSLILENNTVNSKYHFVITSVKSLAKESSNSPTDAAASSAPVVQSRPIASKAMPDILLPNEITLPPLSVPLPTQYRPIAPRPLADLLPPSEVASTSSALSSANRKEYIRPVPISKLLATSDSLENTTTNISEADTSKGNTSTSLGVRQKGPYVTSCQLEHSKIAHFYKCPLHFCIFSCFRRNEFIKHLDTHTDGLVDCVYCQNMVHLSVYLVHLEECHANCRFACSLCFYRASNPTFVRNHVDLQHGNAHKVMIVATPLEMLPRRSLESYPIPPIRDLVRPYVCGEPDCDMKTIFSNVFLEHVKTKHNRKKTFCGICSVKLTSGVLPHYWDKHGMYAYTCRYCPKGSQKLNSVTDHQATEHYYLPFCVLYRRRRGIQSLLRIQDEHSNMIILFEKSIKPTRTSKTERKTNITAFGVTKVDIKFLSHVDKDNSGVLTTVPQPSSDNITTHERRELSNVTPSADFEMVLIDEKQTLSRSETPCIGETDALSESREMLEENPYIGENLTSFRVSSLSDPTEWGCSQCSGKFNTKNDFETHSCKGNLDANDTVLNEMPNISELTMTSQSTVLETSIHDSGMNTVTGDQEPIDEEQESMNDNGVAINSGLVDANTEEQDPLSVPSNDADRLEKHVDGTFYPHCSICNLKCDMNKQICEHIVSAKDRSRSSSSNVDMMEGNVLKNFVVCCEGKKIVTKSKMIVQAIILPLFVTNRYVCGGAWCFQRFTDEDTLKTHLQYAHATETCYTCHFCKVKVEFKSEPINVDAILKHTRLHGPDLYQCNYCQYLDDSKQDAAQHTVEMHSEQPFVIIALRVNGKQMMYVRPKIPRKYIKRKKLEIGVKGDQPSKAFSTGGTPAHAEVNSSPDVIVLSNSEDEDDNHTEPPIAQAGESPQLFSILNSAGSSAKTQDGLEKCIADAEIVFAPSREGCSDVRLELTDISSESINLQKNDTMEDNDIIIIEEVSNSMDDSVKETGAEGVSEALSNSSSDINLEPFDSTSSQKIEDNDVILIEEKLNPIDDGAKEDDVLEEHETGAENIFEISPENSSDVTVKPTESTDEDVIVVDENNTVDTVAILIRSAKTKRDDVEKGFVQPKGPHRLAMKDSYQCPLCDLNTILVLRFYRHLFLETDAIKETFLGTTATESDVKAWICKLIIYQTRILNHWKDINNKLDCLCRFCPLRCQRMASMKHELTHFKQLPYYCNHCDYKSLCNDDMDIHLLNHKSIPNAAYSTENLHSYPVRTPPITNKHDIFLMGIMKESDFECIPESLITTEIRRCTYCPAFSGDLSELLVHHEKRHSTEEAVGYEFTCEECIPCVFFDKLTLLNHHVNVVHNGQAKKRLHFVGSDKLSCIICKKIFHDKYLLRIHLTTHYKRYSCKYCPYLTWSWRCLWKHYFDHHKRKPFEFFYNFLLDNQLKKSKDKLELKLADGTPWR